MTQDQIDQLKQALANYQSRSSQDSLLVAAFEIAINLATGGYAIDQTAITSAVAEQVSDVQAENVTIKERVASLTAQISALETSNAEKEATINELQAYKDSHPDS